MQEGRAHCDLDKRPRGLINANTHDRAMCKHDPVVPTVLSDQSSTVKRAVLTTTPTREVAVVVKLHGVSS